MPTSDYTPSLAEVASLVRNRTKDDNGNELGTFTAATRPTDAQATVLIGMAAQAAENKIGSDIPAELFDNAKTLVAYKAAALIEATYYAEQIRSGRSPYEIYKNLFDEGLPILDTAVSVVESGGELGDDAGTSAGLPSYGFPEDDPNYPGLVGWGTKF